MTAFYIILAAAPVLLLTAVAFLVLIAIGIRKGDRRDLASPPQNRLDAMTRRMTGTAARNDTGNDEEGR
jgi:hypothetical protein